MNTTIENTIPGQPLAYHHPEVAQRVQGWLTSGKPLVWIPILSQENFPDAPPEILQWLDSRQAALHVPISEPADLLRMPEDVTARSTSWACRTNARGANRPCLASVSM